MLQDILARVPARSIDDVVAMMTMIDDRLPDADGLKWFNRLYLRVTEHVLRAVAVDRFADPAFMSALDVVFANLYFDALVQAERDAVRVPSAWKPLLEGRGKTGVARLQFALAGMNAHINRDLPAGIVKVFEGVGGDPLTGQLQRRDFDSLNAVLEQVEAEVKSEFSIGLVAVVDELAGRADDVAAIWKVRKARSAAWTNAEVLWTLRRAPVLQSAFFEKLDSLTGLASRGFLLPKIG